MTDLQLFNHPDFGELHMIEIDGKPYAAATDTARILGYADPHGAISRHCRYPCKQRVPHPQSPNRTIEMNFIPEGDLYRLIVNSQLPSAEKFERWVFDEILPSVMRTGSYNLPQLTQAEMMLQMAQNMVEMEREVKALKEAQTEQDKRVEAVEQIALESAVKLENTLKVFAKPGTDWRGAMYAAVTDLIETNRLSQPQFWRRLYSEVEAVAGVNLERKLSRLKGRLRKQGASKTELKGVLKLDAIARDKKLMPIMESVVRRYQAIYAQD